MKHNKDYAMFENPEDLKDFILWAKQQGVQAFKVAEVEISFSPYAVAEAQEQQAVKANPTTPEPNTNEDDELLYWSSAAR